MGHLRIKIGCNPQELIEAQRLRYEVFNCEMGAGLAKARETGLDQDEFDDICEHLIIVDAAKNEIIGTYRMLLDSVADAHGGFYSQKEFDLTNIRRLDGRLLEVGRSCVHKHYRRRGVLNMLWKGIAQYVRRHGVRYVFGCVSVFTLDRQEISRYFYALQKMNHLSDIDVCPVDSDHRVDIDPSVADGDPQESFVRLPALFRAYLHVGMKVCGVPSIDREFGSTDFFILLDTENMNPIYKKHFFSAVSLREAEAPLGACEQ